MSKSSKRKKGPWNPATQPRPTEFSEQLGFPTKERLRHSKTGFAPEQLAVGHREHGRIRSREKSPLTHPSLIADMQAAKVKNYAESGKELPPDGVSIPLTPSDRVTATNRRLLWQYIQTKIETELGRSKSINYEGASRSSELHRLPLSDSEFNRRGFFEWLKKQPGWGYFTSYLDKFVELVEPSISDDRTRILSKSEIGMWLGDTDSSRDAKNIADGGLAVVCHGLAEAAADYAMFKRNERKIGKNNGSPS